MDIKAEEISTGEINVKFSTSVLVKSWDDATKLISEMKVNVSSFEVKR